MKAYYAKSRRGRGQACSSAVQHAGDTGAESKMHNERSGVRGVAHKREQACLFLEPVKSPWIQAFYLFASVGLLVLNMSTVLASEGVSLSI